MISNQAGPLSAWAGSNFLHLCAFYCLSLRGAPRMSKTPFQDQGCRSSKPLRTGAPAPARMGGRRPLDTHLFRMSGQVRPQRVVRSHPGEAAGSGGGPGWRSAVDVGRRATRWRWRTSQEVAGGTQGPAALGSKPPGPFSAMKAQQPRDPGGAQEGRALPGGRRQQEHGVRPDEDALHSQATAGSVLGSWDALGSHGPPQDTPPLGGSPAPM